MRSNRYIVLGHQNDGNTKVLKAETKSELLDLFDKRRKLKALDLKEFSSIEVFPLPLFGSDNPLLEPIQKLVEMAAARNPTPLLTDSEKIGDIWIISTSMKIEDPSYRLAKGATPEEAMTKFIGNLVKEHDDAIAQGKEPLLTFDEIVGGRAVTRAALCSNGRPGFDIVRGDDQRFDDVFTMSPGLEVAAHNRVENTFQRSGPTV